MRNLINNSLTLFPKGCDSLWLPNELGSTTSQWRMLSISSQDVGLVVVGDNEAVVSTIKHKDIPCLLDHRITHRTENWP